MENKELTHWGIKGMKWGIRRFQNKDGSLTAAGKKRRKEDDDKKEETVEERRSRLLKSTNAKELYENRHLLTTAELNERLNRMDTERRLSEVAARNKRSGMEMVDKALKIGRKINEIYEFTNTPVMKALKKKLGLEEVEERLGLEKAYKLKDKLSDKQLQEVLRRTNTERAMKKILDDDAAARDKRAAEKAAKDAENQKAEANKEAAREKAAGFYSKKGNDIIDRTLSVITDMPTRDVATPSNVALGQSAIAGLLEEPK